MEEKLFELLFIKSVVYEKVAQELNIPIQKVRDYYNKTSKERKKEIEELRRIRSLYNNKEKLKNKNEVLVFKWQGFPEFYKWYLDQEKAQNNQCYYCKADEFKIRALVEDGFFGNSKQMTNRGRHLEIERKDSDKNDYSSENCVLACYFCNNDKSDVITEADYFKYFVNGNPSNRKRYIDDSYAELQKKNNGK